MTQPDESDSLWDQAMTWVLQAHEQTLDDEALARFAAWIEADPAHRKAYEEAAQLWTLTGLVPPKE